MSGVLLHTLVWTGVLIAAVLLLRRPVTRHFGPQAAYALWALPAARLLLPPVTLPAWMALPAPLPRPEPAISAAEPVIWQAAGEAPAAMLAPASLAAATAPAPAPEAGAGAGFDLLAALADVPVLEAFLLVWLGGAAVFLWRRFAAYFALRAALLAEGREVGRVPGPLGPVRLIETPATAAPLALGVLDPVIAMPPEFLALPDRPARDLALAHELAHHRGGDLVVNILVQPLFALHWFTPLAHYGWLALRRDQEAACDARVMAARTPQERAAYAALIARFAAAPGAASVLGGAALTAPMACPVLGEKSIIHRLRSLAMSDLSPRRRLAGRALLGAGLLALPLTASMSYAASDAATHEAPEPPAPPAPPEAPQPPAPPLPPEAPDGKDDVEITEHVWRDADGRERRVKMVLRGGAEEARMLSELHGLKASEAEREAMLAEMRAGLAEADRALADMPRLIDEAMAAADGANRQRVIVRQECRPGSDEVSETTTRDGSQIISICQKRIFASARRGLEEARAEIARDREIPEATRKQLLETLDRQIERWSEQEG